MGTVAFLRNYHIAKYLSRLFDSSHLITIKNISIPLRDDIPNDFIEEHRVFNFDYRNLGNLMSSPKNDIRNKTNTKSTSGNVKFIRKILDSFPTNLLFGEGGLLYIINGTFKGIKLVKKNNITHLYSSFRPIADHVIAYNLKTIFPHLNWIADFRDPYIDESRNHVYQKKLQWWFLNKLLSKANKVITVSDGVTSVIKKAKENTYTFKNGIYRIFDFRNESKFNKFTLSFTGSIYKEFHKPDFLFKALKLLHEKNKINSENFQIIYAGKDGLIWDEWISKYELDALSVNLSEISLIESLKVQFKSNINILFSWSNEEVTGLLSGKLFEYLSTGNPIFTFINGGKDQEFEDIFKELHAGFVFYNNESENIANQIFHFYHEWKTFGYVDFNYNELIEKDFSWESKLIELKDLIK